GAMAALVYCASDYVGAWGGIELLRRRNLTVDLVAGSVTDSQMGEDYIEGEFNVAAGNARRDGRRMFEIVEAKVASRKSQVASPLDENALEAVLVEA
ncbi:MAG TPA: hypothetical protein VGB76_00290, partial [Pyrinomonadaceae bacterium]